MFQEIAVGESVQTSQTTKLDALRKAKGELEKAVLSAGVESKVEKGSDLEKSFRAFVTATAAAANELSAYANANLKNGLFTNAKTGLRTLAGSGSSLQETITAGVSAGQTAGELYASLQTKIAQTANPPFTQIKNSITPPPAIANTPEGAAANLVSTQAQVLGQQMSLTPVANLVRAQAASTQEAPRVSADGVNQSFIDARAERNPMNQFFRLRKAIKDEAEFLQAKRAGVLERLKNAYGDDGAQGIIAQYDSLVKSLRGVIEKSPKVAGNADAAAYGEATIALMDQYKKDASFETKDGVLKSLGTAVADSELRQVLMRDLKAPERPAGRERSVTSTGGATQDATPSPQRGAAPTTQRRVSPLAGLDTRGIISAGTFTNAVEDTKFLVSQYPEFFKAGTNTPDGIGLGRDLREQAKKTKEELEDRFKKYIDRKPQRIFGQIVSAGGLAGDTIPMAIKRQFDAALGMWFDAAESTIREIESPSGSPTTRANQAFDLSEKLGALKHGARDDAMNIGRLLDQFNFRRVTLNGVAMPWGGFFGGGFGGGFGPGFGVGGPMRRW